MGIRIAIVGDSQAGGLERPLARELARRGADVIATEHRDGASTRAVLEAGILTRVLARRPELLVVMLGGNDTRRAAASWLELADRARAAGAPLVWIGPPAAAHGGARDSERRAVSDAQQMALGARSGVIWVSGRRTAAGLPHRDEVHFTPAGYETWAARLASRIVRPARAPTLLVAAAVAYGVARLFQDASALRPKREVDRTSAHAPGIGFVALRRRGSSLDCLRSVRQLGILPTCSGSRLPSPSCFY